MKVGPFLDGEYRSLETDLSAYSQASILYNIIQVKIEDGSSEVKNHHQPLYVDVKLFIRKYLESVTWLAYGYDQIDLEKIFEILEKMETKESIAINNYLERMLVSNGYTAEAEKVKRQGIRLTAFSRRTNKAISQ